MELFYISDVPFSYEIRSNLADVSLSEDLRNDFNKVYMGIKTGRINIDSVKLIPEIQMLTDRVKQEVSNSGNSKSIYVRDYATFLFGVCLLILKKENYSQNQLSRLLGLNENKFSKLDIYPKRCFDAYTKMDSVDKINAIMPYKYDSVGIQIAQYINTNIQTSWACYGFLGITNDLDLFANISTTSNKAFVLTTPMQFDDGDIESISKANYSFARFQFALGNQLFDDDGIYVSAGEIKRKILELLEIKDYRVLSADEQDIFLRQILLSSQDLKQYLMETNISDFEEDRLKYRISHENMEEARHNLEDGYSNLWASSFYENRGVILEKGEKAEDLSPDLIMQRYYENMCKETEKLENKLLGELNVISMLRSDKIDFKTYLASIRKFVKTNVIVKRKSVGKTSEGMMEFAEPKFEDRIRSAACFWITEAFREYDGDEDFYNQVMMYLKKKSPIFRYFDALNAPPVGKMENASADDRTNIHIYMRDEQFSLTQQLNSFRIKISEDCVRPLMIYIDTSAYQLDKEEVEDLLKQYNILLIVRDELGLTQEWGMYTLDEKLRLYSNKKWRDNI